MGATSNDWRALLAGWSLRRAGVALALWFIALPTATAASAQSAALVVAEMVSPDPMNAANFLVNSTLDEPRNPAAPAGVCQSTPSGVCTLRAAIQTANALSGPDSITLPANPPYVLSLGTLLISSELTINGAGA